jgi:catalase
MLAETPRRVHTDIVAHSADGFPGSNGDEALAFFKAIAAGTVPEFLGSHPKALAFVMLPKPTPTSFAHEQFFAVNAIRLINSDDKVTNVRYRILPVLGVEALDDEALKTKSPNFLYDELPELVAKGPIEFKLVAQIAEEGDVTNDNTVKWPAERRVAELGTISLTSIADDNAALAKTIIFDPVPRVPGLEPSDDPLLDVRAGVYLISGKQRRAA